MKIVDGLLTVLFTLFAAWQWNDPDGLFWIGVYSFVAVAGVLTALRRAPRRLLQVALPALTVGAVYLLPNVRQWVNSGDDLITGMSADRMYVERSRECLGLLPAAAFFIYQTPPVPRRAS
ncbi:MAG: transmembrane 220 family protein [Catalinimonas sp.]